MVAELVEDADAATANPSMPSSVRTGVAGGAGIAMPARPEAGVFAKVYAFFFMNI